MSTYSIEEIENQLLKACQIFMHYKDPSPTNIKSTLGGLTGSSYEKKAFYPTPKEIDMADTVQFVWLRFLSPDDRRIVWKKYEGTPLKILAHQEGLSLRQLRYRIEKALNKIKDELQKQK